MGNGEPVDRFLELVRQVASEFYEVFGELGREGDEDVWYLARGHDDGKLVALKLHRTGQGPDGKPAYDLEVAQELDSQVSVGSEVCPACNATLRRWARFCTNCGVDLTEAGGGTPSSPPAREALLEQVKGASAGVYDVIGEMPWAGGAGHVYFALEKATKRLVRLRLRSDAGGGRHLAETQVFLPIAERVAATYVTSIFEKPMLSADHPLPADPPARPSVSVSRPTGRRPAPAFVVIFGRELPAMLVIRVLAGAVALLLFLQLLQLLF